MSNVNDYAKALGQLEGAVKAALVELDHDFLLDAKRRLRGALVRVEEILSEKVPPHHLPDGTVKTQIQPVSENVEGRNVLEPGLDYPDTTEEKRGER